MAEDLLKHSGRNFEGEVVLSYLSGSPLKRKRNPAQATSRICESPTKMTPAYLLLTFAALASVDPATAICSVDAIADGTEKSTTKHQINREARLGG